MTVAFDDPVLAAADRFLKTFQRPVRLLAAVSGGSDSTGLFVAFATLLSAGRHPHITLCAATVDHDLRAGSVEEAAAVAALCARHGIAHVTRRWDGPKPVSGLQAAARAERYRLLVDAARAMGADAILAAHTRSDQSETVAMRAARAPEGIGLSGMAEGVLLDGAVWLLRPFLAVERQDIRTFLAARGEGWIEDPSNLNPRFERVRVRDAGEGPEAAAGRLSLSQRAAAFLLETVTAEGPLFTLPAPAVTAALADPAAWRGLLVLAATAGGRAHGLEARSAARLRTFLASGTLSRLTAGRVVFDRRRDGLHLYRECRGIVPLAVAAGDGAVWDGRCRVVNRTSRALVVSAAGDAAGGELRGPALRAARAAPRLNFGDGGAAREGVEVVPVIAPYAHFLPRFDLPLAQALAGLLGCAPFPSPPNE